ncbi:MULTISPECIES: hypothetical protein [Cryobacterium]|uniref:Uncharacterized protein n=1 Tax=Cryobacterium levicorallinum TaxID=995038 RepID=A0A1I3EMA1_9MICO|nr:MULTISPECIES: hypothetical protein [Cryobacterium]TFB84199.1 hypothetical protein E3O11_10095 [Cryobacterium levicorallinum]TFD55639.1 hypothetical protein E3T41_17305 [Cryobacterium sp. Hh38]GEP28848.1 hypothetical protein CLE01_34460 [Cryobacterium levicorallinum]SFI00089.1 hypothetical protein SAMN05216274_1293 [Cryobacterium levicorallinum]
MAEIQIALSTIYQRQFRKLKSDDLRKQALEAQRDILHLLQLQAAGKGSESESRSIATRRRIKVIQRFKSISPKRFEATFAPDGRLAWSFDGTTLAFLLIGTHKVLDMD